MTFTSITKREFKNNILRFAIGTILLIICYGYLTNHPAERLSLLSGFSIMGQRIGVFFTRIQGEDTQALERKYSLQKTYQELLSALEVTQCKDEELKKRIQESQTLLKSLTLNDFKKQENAIETNAFLFNQNIKEYCK